MEWFAVATAEYGNLQDYDAVRCGLDWSLWWMDRCIWFRSRADDVIKTCGERPGPFEVESAPIGHPAVQESVVIGRPDRRGEIVKAFVVLPPGHEHSGELRQDIVQFARTRLAYHAYPREVEFMDSLPKTRSGRIMRRVPNAWGRGDCPGTLSGWRARRIGHLPRRCIPLYIRDANGPPGSAMSEDKSCKCERCTSYPDCGADQGLRVFCLRGKATCQVTMRGCLCTSCKVHEMYSLRREYYCLQGAEKRAF